MRCAVLGRARHGCARLALAAILASCGGDPPVTPLDAAVPVDATPDAPGHDASVYDELTQTMEDELDAKGTYSAALAIVEHGEVTYAHGFGQRRPGDPTPVAPTTRFRVASLTKMMTAIAVLQQVEAGTLTLETPVITVLPELRFASSPEAWVPEITPHHLLAHGSGMTRAYDDGAGCPLDETGLACWVGSQGFADHVWLMSAPGSVWSYSNVGYRVAGALLERASGRYFRPYLHDRVFEPLAMTRTTFAASEVLADGDFTVADTLNTGVTSHTEPFLQPSGGAFSTVLDLAKLARFLIRGDDAVLAPGLLAAMTSPQLDTRWTLDHEQYGYGLFVDDGLALLDYTPYDFTVLLHDGLLPGYNALFLVIPSHEFAFIFLASGQATFPSATLDHALHRILGLPAIPPLPLTEDPAAFVRYANTYRAETPDGPVQLAVTLEPDGALRASGALSCTLVPQRVANFTCVGEWLTFVVLDDRPRADYVRFGELVLTRTSP